MDVSQVGTRLLLGRVIRVESTMEKRNNSNMMVAVATILGSLFRSFIRTEVVFFCALDEYLCCEDCINNRLADNNGAPVRQHLDTYCFHLYTTSYIWILVLRILSVEKLS